MSRVHANEVLFISTSLFLLGQKLDLTPNSQRGTYRKNIGNTVVANVEKP